MSETPLQVIPLGGLGEIGKNMMAFQYGRDVLIVDAGLMFPENDMLGIDYIIPDFRYLSEQSGLRVRGILITHGHEDHTGAIQHVASAFPAPIYATPLTAGLVEVKLRQARLLDRVQLNVFNASDKIDLSPFWIETFHVCHSIPDCVGFGINTPVGLFVHTGDFKFDPTPVDRRVTDYAKLASFSARGVVALFSDSTNADRRGWTPSESVIDAAFDRVFRAAKGRVIVSSFASLISRVQQVVWVSERYGRKIAIIGTSMSENVRMALNLGYLDLPESMLISPEEARHLPPNQVTFIVTGSQGEPSAVLHRLATNNHNMLSIQAGDTVIISAHPIPGNEETVSRTINRLFQRGAQVVYDPIDSVHVSGHASQEEQRLMLNLVQPRNFVPIHGELRHLKAHRELALQVGIPDERIAVVENGTKLFFYPDGRMSIGERVPGGYVFVDGSGVGDVHTGLIREREALGRDGAVVLSAVIERGSGRILGQPEIRSFGFVASAEGAALLQSGTNLARQVLEQSGGSATHKRELVEEALSKLFYSEIRRRPKLFVTIHEV
ncbi:MAG: ribonuclease J [Candidatus Thermofonsia Clade 1 bacterium]|jgi:ribonuclease J|uniref:Ribonuclease J n=1 Tax=Candidatus Thermofonsia Clade 1 bacterium TaxID=2364210 RepID=A0A2M8PZ86_9CHLR|nr:MAG: ribonuclease J [Candidatus Thermofonsia Clade 1 bacterium]PJF42866.1 MAG: ribonuclease J [Candidatus Thermofonsia Clade 1 bacterium]RMF50508.1 MAG: ribonuclease J [Chloroflexota bacterium]